MTNRPGPLRIVQVNTSDIGGGAERVALQLHAEYRRAGHDAQLAVGFRRSNAAGVFRLRHEDAAPPSRAWAWQAFAALQPLYRRVPGGRALCRAAHWLAAPEGRIARRAGFEDFDYPGAWTLPAANADVIHAHNLHGGYFDLRAVPTLSRCTPFVLTLHDAWLAAGHCAHSLGCERWRSGCGDCPDLGIYPAIRHDQTAANWRRKREILAASQIHLAAPSRWLMERFDWLIAHRSVLSHRVIPNGVDRRIFRPASEPRAALRSRLQLPRDAHIVLFAANGLRRNRFKDLDTLRAAVARASTRLETPLLLLALGEAGADERLERAHVRYLPPTADPSTVASLYQAANLYLHAAHADTFPNTILEALACGTPCVATAVGGIPEQIVDLHAARGSDQPTGRLVPPRDSPALAAAIGELLTNDNLWQRLAQNAAADAALRFDLEAQARAYLDWFREILAAERSLAQPHGASRPLPVLAH